MQMQSLKLSCDICALLAQSYRHPACSVDSLYDYVFNKVWDLPNDIHLLLLLPPSFPPLHSNNYILHLNEVRGLRKYKKARKER